MVRASFFALILPAVMAAVAGCATTSPSPAKSGPYVSVDARLWTDFHDHPAGYLPETQEPSALAFLPAPPAPGSPRAAADLALYKTMLSEKGAPRWALAIKDADVETPLAPQAFDCALGLVIDPNTMPVLTRLLAKTMMDVDQAGEAAKTRYARKRPFLQDDGPICIEKADWLVKQGSYPSGHAGAGWAWALVLSELRPDRTNALLQRGRQYGQSRIVCRVHYQSDVDAGREVGAAVVARLHAEPAFDADLKAARAELRTAETSGAPPTQCAAETAALVTPSY
jgi:acid phosphatase (class A)